MNQDDLKEIKQDIKELVRQGAIHNTLLQEHERRSIALEKRQDAYDISLQPIKAHVQFINMVLKSVGALSLSVGGLLLGKLALRTFGLL